MSEVDPKASAGIGLISGLVGISCCVSPVVLYLLGLATATEAVGLGNTLYGRYAWYFRLAGLLVGGAAITLYLRRRGVCDLRGARANWKPLAGAGLTAVATYVALYAFTTWLGTLAPKS